MVTTVGEAIDALKKLPKDKKLVIYNAENGVFEPVVALEKVMVKPDRFYGVETDMMAHAEKGEPEANLAVWIKTYE